MSAKCQCQERHTSGGQLTAARLVPLLVAVRSPTLKAKLICFFYFFGGSPNRHKNVNFFFSNLIATVCFLSYIFFFSQFRPPLCNTKTPHQIFFVSFVFLIFSSQDCHCNYFLCSNFVYPPLWQFYATAWWFNCDRLNRVIVSQCIVVFDISC